MGLGPKCELKWNDGRSKLSKQQRQKRLAGKLRYFTEKVRHSTSEVIIPRKCIHSGLNAMSDFVKMESPSSTKEGAEEDSLTAERSMSQLTGQYNQSLLEQPHDVGLWVEFLAFQDHLLEWGHLPGDRNDHVARKKQVLTERKMAIYERALELNPLSEELLVGYMSSVREKWDTDTIIRKWKDLVFRQPNSPKLWMGYIHFCQTNFSSFTASSLTSLYAKCISTLAAIVEGSLKSHVPLPDTPAFMLAVFSLYCSHLKQVGLTERAVASYQALIEFNLCLPHKLKGQDTSLQTLKEFLEPFWDSGTPRFGESGALGWSNWTEMSEGGGHTHPLGLLTHKLNLLEKEPGESEKQKEEAETSLLSSLAVPQAWLELEGYRMMHNSFPWQPDMAEGETVEDCSDPDRIMTFDDVSQTLFRITDPDLQLNLVISFLSFLGVPTHSPALSPLADGVGVGVAYGVEHIHEILCISDTCLSPEEGAYSCGYLSAGLGVPSSFTPSSSLLDLATTLANRTLSSIFLSKSLTRTREVSFFISNVCNHALSLFPTTRHQTKLAQLWLAHLHCKLLCKVPVHVCDAPLAGVRAEIRSIEKLWKELFRLQCHRNNLDLWGSYVLFHYSLGNFKETKKVYKIIVAQTSRLSPRLCRCLCECFMGLGWRLSGEGGEAAIDHNLAIHALICLIEGNNSPVVETMSPARLLKARTHFSSSSNQAMADSADIALCHCYFEYLTRGLRDACNVVDRWRSKFITDDLTGKRRTSNSLKVVYMKQLQLMEHHSLHHLPQPAISRELLGRAMEVFPDEAYFMGAFIRQEQQTFISGRMRRFFDKTTGATRCALPWLFSLVAEFDRYSRITGRQRGGGDKAGREGGEEGVEEMSVGTVCRIMSVLTRATAGDAGKHCPLLWRLFMAVQVCCLLPPLPSQLVPAWLQCGSVWLSVAQCGSVWLSVAQCGSVWLSVAQCGSVWLSVAQCGSVWLSVAQCGSVWLSVAQCGSVWLSVVQCGSVWFSVVWSI